MKLVPRAEEVTEVVTLIQSNLSPDDKAKAIIRHVAEMMWFREWTVVAQPKGPWWGPFSSDAEAKELMSKVPLATGDKAVIVKVHGPGRTLTEREGGGFGFCVNCTPGHQAYAHRMVGTSRGPCVLCNCKGYAAEKKKPVKRVPRKKVTS